MRFRIGPIHEQAANSLKWCLIALALGALSCGEHTGRPGASTSALTVCQECGSVILGRERVLDGSGKMLLETTSAQPLPNDFWNNSHGDGLQSVDGLWLTGNIYASVPASEVAGILARSDVAEIELVEPVSGASETAWDGKDIKHGWGLNAGLYIDYGFNGNYWHPSTGLRLRVAIVDEGFDSNHPALLDASGGTTRVAGTYNCINNPCTVGSPYPPSGNHGSWVTGAAVADLRDGQMGGTADWQLDRTGTAEETEIFLIDIGTYGHGTSRGIQQALNLFADVIVLTRNGNASPCDGNWSDFDEAIWNAHSAGKIVVTAAGNAGDPGSCSLGPGADNLAGFVVGVEGVHHVRPAVHRRRGLHVCPRCNRRLLVSS